MPSPLPFHSQRQRNKEVKCNLSHAMSCRGKPSSTAHNIINPRHKESAEDTTIFSMCEQMVAFRVQFHGIICSVTHLEYRTAKNLRVQIVACFCTEKVGCAFRLRFKSHPIFAFCISCQFLSLADSRAKFGCMYSGGEWRERLELAYKYIGNRFLNQSMNPCCDNASLSSFFLEF